MAERIVSPGVFTNEVDQSFLAGGVAAIGAAVIGPTVKGPALIPTQIRNYGEFVSTFGSYTDDSYVPFVVQDYLRNGSVITVTRLLYEDGYSLSNGVLAIIAKSGSGAGKVEVVTHVLHPTTPVNDTTGSVFENSVLLDAGSGSFAIKLSGSYDQFSPQDDAIGFDGSFLVAEGVAISASLNPNANDYVNKVFGTGPKSVDYPVYTIYSNPTAYAAFANPGNITTELAIISNYAVLQDYNTAATPWITSQKIGSVAKDLFRFHTLSHGTSVNHEVKVGIRDIRTSTEVSDPNGYGTFTVEVRRVNTTNIPGSPYSSQDTDRNPDIVETFLNVNLDPNSSRYIARVIGDRYQTVTDNNDIVVNGDYPNISKFIRVQVTTGVSTSTNEKTLIPFGFRAPNAPIPLVSGSLNLTATSYRTTQVNLTYGPNTYFGFDFTNINNLNYLAPLPTTGENTGSNSDFYLGNMNQDAAANFPTSTTAYSGSLESALTGGTFTTNIATSTRKFIIPFQGGFDGAKPNLKKYSGANITSANTFGFNCTDTSTGGTKAYNKAFAILGNTDYYDINMLITPGIIDEYHSVVSSAARNLAEARQDTFYVMDSNGIDKSLTAVTTQVATLDSNYTSTYWPWVRITNPAKNVPVWVPPSVVVPGVLAFNDSVAAPWYAPAGLTRGGLTTVSDTYVNLNQSARDTLYEARVNPIANFPNEGVVIWGQKTLQGQPSALDRVNVRRLLITVKKFIASSTRFLVFEQNTDATRLRFLSIVNPYLDQVKANQGLSAFRVVMDDSNNTPDLIDQNILYGQIFLQPTRTAEFIILDFNIQPTGASFPE
jgi:hypothetical protein